MAGGTDVTADVRADNRWLNQYLLPDEVLIWAVSAAVGYYDLARQDWVRELRWGVDLGLWFLLRRPSPLYFLALPLTLLGGFGATRRGAPPSVVGFGAGRRCAAVRLGWSARRESGPAGEPTGHWILTSHRFSFIRAGAPGPGEAPSTGFELSRDEFIRIGAVVRQLPPGRFSPDRGRYERIIFRDGSGFDLHRPVTGRPVAPRSAGSAPSGPGDQGGEDLAEIQVGRLDRHR